MDCAEIRDAFLRGETLPEDRVQAHLRVCPHCHELFEGHVALGQRLGSAATPELSLPDDFFAQLEQKVSAETGMRAWLRSRPTRVRVLLVSTVAVAAITIGGALHLRPDFAEYPSSRLALLLGVYLLAVLVAVQRELSVSSRPGAFATKPGVLAGTLLLPFLVAFVPPTEASMQHGPEGALICFSFGALLTLPLAALLWACDRDDRPSSSSVWLSAVALGLTANLLLELHCASGNAIHLLLGHASLSLAWLAVWAALRGLKARAH